MLEQQTIEPKKIDAQNDEIDLIALAKQLWNGRKIIFIALSISTVLGIFVALISPKEYTASTVMVPQLGESKSLGGLGGLAALAGISLDVSQGTELSPLIYPQIVSSVPFQLELMNTPLNFSKTPKPVSLYDYSTIYNTSSLFGVLKKYTIGLPGVILNALQGKKIEVAGGTQGNEPIVLTQNQETVRKMIAECVTLDVNAKEGYLTLTARMPEALVAAQLAQKGQELLQQYITNFKIEKAAADLNFIQGRYNETKAEFEKAQVELASTNDRSRFFTSEVSSIGKDRIQTRYSISYSIFQELSKQLEQAKIQVKKETPVFTIIEPVTVPSEKSKPKKAQILLIWIFLGGVIGVGIVFGKEFLGTIKKKWNESEAELPLTTKGEQES